ncbi:MAG: rRNA biogenesis protein rrp5 [Clostridium sp.]|nr:rRNA biogenesis protein rrp5 [Clostridium sp.]MCM1534661.1 rRNA biogenesis protein rrp5 [Clostridium sp.]
MSRIKLLLDVIEDVRSLGDSLQALADAMASDEPKEEPKKKAKAGSKSEKTKAEETVPAEKNPLTLEEVRMVLAEKSRAGHTAEVREILQRHGAEKLSDVDPAEYESLIAEAEVL